MVCSFYIPHIILTLPLCPTHTHDDGDNVFDFYLFSFYLYLGRLLRRFRVPVSCINFPYRISKWMKIAFIFLVLLIHDVSISMNIIYWSCMRVCVCVYKWMSGFIPTNRQTRMKKKTSKKRIRTKINDLYKYSPSIPLCWGSRSRSRSFFFVSNEFLIRCCSTIRNIQCLAEYLVSYWSNYDPQVNNTVDPRYLGASAEHFMYVFAYEIALECW